MKSGCLNDQELTLHYYGELTENTHHSQHLSECLVCTKRLAELRKDLELLPKLDHTGHPAVATRMAARVSENLNRPRRRWIPAISTLTVSACALIATFIMWSPPQDLPQTAQTTLTPAAINLDEDMPDIDFLEDMDLLLELDLLSQVEGV